MTTTKWKAVCRTCNSPAFYYPAKLLIQSTAMLAQESTQSKGPLGKQVSVTCTGELSPTGDTHSLDYVFDADFTKID